MLRNIPKERKSQLHCDGSLKYKKKSEMDYGIEGKLHRNEPFKA
jgi:hypothetical protein